MNVTELARKLNTDKDKLLKILPKYGYDIGKKAIKIDDKVAQQVMEEWSDIKKDIEKKRKKKQEKRKQKKKEMRKQQVEQKEIELPESITVKNLAEKMNMAVSELISHLMDDGILANKNQELDFETASIVAEDLDFEVKEKDSSDVETEGGEHGKVLRESLDRSEKLQRRPPVIIVMGHVDHGKTKLLDAIRQKNKIDQEAGSITQHIGAYQAAWEDPEDDKEKKMTFIDTPGHKAFTVMRSRGAKVADIAILVVAADDGVQPQTKEAIQIMKAANLPFVVAINKIDKSGIDIERTKKQLSDEDVIPEEWGGDTPMVEISAKQETNIDDLLDMILLVSDMNEDDIQADPDMPAIGTVIESHKDKQMGSVATILIQNGTLEAGDPLIINGADYGNVRRMWNHKGEDIDSAGPSVPAQMIGFDVTPEVGDILDVSKADEAEKVDAREKEMEQTGAQKGSLDSGEGKDKNTLNLYVKADVLGSLEALTSTLEEIEHEEVGVKVVGKGLGNITVDDVNKAEAGNAALVGFQVEPTYSAEELIQDKDLEIKCDDVIYDITEWVNENLESLLEDETITEKTGNLKVLAIFSEETSAMTVGGRVESGYVEVGAKAKVKRDGEVVGEGKVENLKQGQQDKDKIKAGKECGVRFKGKTEIKEDDVLDFYKTETKKKSLDLE
ncbi:MAG: translation initiation factor IF-2 [Candidatus Paceibacteria bacterium]